LKLPKAIASIHAPAQRGFTLIELLIAIAIVSIAAATSVPSFRVWVENFRLAEAANGVVDGLYRARSEAVKRNKNVVMRFTGSSWQLFVDDGTGGGTGGNFTRDGSETILRTVAAPSGISFHEVKFGVNPYTGFNSRGMPINSNCAGTAKGKNASGKTFSIALSLAGSVVKQ